MHCKQDKSLADRS